MGFSWVWTSGKKSVSSKAERGDKSSFVTAGGALTTIVMLVTGLHQMRSRTESGDKPSLVMAAGARNTIVLALGSIHEGRNQEQG